LKLIIAQSSLDGWFIDYRKYVDQHFRPIVTDLAQLIYLNCLSLLAAAVAAAAMLPLLLCCSSCDSFDSCGSLLSNPSCSLYFESVFVACTVGGLVVGWEMASHARWLHWWGTSVPASMWAIPHPTTKPPTLSLVRTRRVRNSLIVVY